MTSGAAWLSSKQTFQGSFVNGYDDPFIDTAEMLKAMTLIDSDWKTGTTEGAAAVKYLAEDGFNNVGTFGSGANLMDDIWALEAYLSMGAELELGLSISPSNSSVTENQTKQFEAWVIGLDGTENVTNDVSWYVSDTSKATIDASGLLTANNSGTIEVRAAYNGLFDETNLTIYDYVAQVERAFVTVNGYGSKILSSSSVTINHGDSVLDVTKNILDSRGISYTASGGYVSEIGGLYEFDHGIRSGWMVKLNGSAPSSGADSVSARDGDSIEWFYSSDWTEEEGVFAGEEGLIEEMAEIVLENADATADELKDAFDSLMKEEGEDAGETLMLLAKAAIKKAGETSIVMNNGKPAEMRASALEDLAEASAEKAAAIQEAFEDEGIVLDKELKSRVAVIVEDDDDTASVAFASGALSRAFSAEVDEVAVVTPWAEVALCADTLSEEDMEKEVVVEVKPVDISDLPEGSDVAKGATILDMNLFLDGVKEIDFNGIMRVSISFDLQKGDDAAALTVYWLKDDGTVVPVGGTYNEETGMIVFETNHFSKYFVDESDVSFEDMELATWAEDEVSAMAGKGFIKGRSQGLFDPSKDITRAEFAAIATRILNLKTPKDYDTGFADVAGSEWYADAVASVKAAGLMNGKGDASFDPNGKITRQEQAVVLANVLKLYGYEDGEADLNDTFEDAESIASWAEDGAVCVVYHGLINGIDGRFAPTERATRAESAVIMYRLYTKILK